MDALNPGPWLPSPRGHTFHSDPGRSRQREFMRGILSVRVSLHYSQCSACKGGGEGPVFFFPIWCWFRWFFCCLQMFAPLVVAPNCGETLRLARLHVHSGNSEVPRGELSRQCDR